jgi:hypothetical protein
MFVATSTYDAKYIILVLAMKQWIWLTNAHEELNVQVTNAPMFYYNNAAIDIAYNHKIGNDPNISTSPIMWYLRELNLDRFLSFRLNRLKIWQISALKDFRRTCTET